MLEIAELFSQGPQALIKAQAHAQVPNVASRRICLAQTTHLREKKLQGMPVVICFRGNSALEKGAPKRLRPQIYSFLVLFFLMPSLFLAVLFFAFLFSLNIYFYFLHAGLSHPWNWERASTRTRTMFSFTLSVFILVLHVFQVASPYLSCKTMKLFLILLKVWNWNSFYVESFFYVNS